MVDASQTSPWYSRWWGIAMLTYLGVTGVLGIGSMIVGRSAASTMPSPTDVVRAGGFTAMNGADTPLRTDVPIVTDADPAIGAENPQLTIVEFSDFECPYCRESFPIIRALAATYGDRIRFVYRDFPVNELHAGARPAAIAAQCAHVQGKFWAYHDKLFQNAPAFARVDLTAYARAVGLDAAAFDTCMDGAAAAAAVDADATAGRQLGVRGTPTWFFLRKGDPATARRVEGVIPREVFEDVIVRAFGWK